VTIRAFKLALEDRLENFGQFATYLGNPRKSFRAPFVLDEKFIFNVGCSLPVDGNTADILTNSRYRRWFKVSPRGPHIGLFNHTKISNENIHKKNRNQYYHL